MQKLFYNGIILTMNEQYPYPEAVLTVGEKIVYVGTKEEAFARADKRAKHIDLKGRTLMPGFFDVQGSFIQSVMAKYKFVDLRCYPQGKIKSIEQAIAVLRGSAQAKKGKGMIVGYGYDDTLCVDGRMLEARDLDRVSKQRPVIVIHRTMHAVMANTKAMVLAGVFDCDYAPEGGNVRRRSGVAIGVFEETAAKPLFDLIDRQYLNRGLLPFIPMHCADYLKQGITVICEGAAKPEVTGLVKKVIRRRGFPARYMVCALMEDAADIAPKLRGKGIMNGPVKLVMDGYIQLFTAALSSPYEITAPGRYGEKDYSGYTQMSVEALRDKVELILKSGRSFAIICNGDAALKRVLEALEGCESLIQNGYKRNLLIGCQLADAEQIDKFQRLQLYPSFLVEPIEECIENRYVTLLGEERALKRNPIGDIVARGIPFSLHCGGFLQEVKPLEAVCHVVSKATKEQKISVLEALKGITIYGAYQYRVEDILGSIEPGKKADFVALDKNPLKVAVDKLSDIQVERTWVNGRLVWSKKRRS